MFDPVSTTAEKVAGPAVFAGGTPYTLCDSVPFRRMVGLFIAFKDHGFRRRVARSSREFLISSGLFVTNQAIDPCLIREIKILTFPTITGVA